MSQLPVGPVPSDLLCLRDAAKLLPSSRAGKRVHASTLYRWIIEKRIRGFRLGRYWYVSRQEVLSLFRPGQAGGG